MDYQSEMSRGTANAVGALDIQKIKVTRQDDEFVKVDPPSNPDVDRDPDPSLKPPMQRAP